MSGLRRWERSRYPSKCQKCAVTIEAADPRFEDRDAKVVLCVPCGLAVVAGSAPANPPPSPQTPPAKAPATQTPPPGRPEPPKAPGRPLAPSKALETDVSAPPRVSIGATIGLPGFSSVRACIEATAEAGESEEACRERIERVVFAQLARQVAVVIAASKDPVAFVREFGDPADPVVAAMVGST